MPLIPTTIHGVLDYLVGVLMIAAPWAFGFGDGGAETWIPVVLGVSVIAYSLLTNYELGLWGMFPMSVHLWLDGLTGVFLAGSPWIFGFADRVWVPHLVLGLVGVVAAITTKTLPERAPVLGVSEAVSGRVAGLTRPRATDAPYPAEPR